MNLVDQYIRLFVGQNYAHGTEHGGCARTPPDFAGHLNGTSEPIGTYPMVVWHDGNWRVGYGVVDLDVRRPNKRAYDYDTEHDAHTAALNLQRTLQHMDIRAWIEVTRSHGRHVWVFAEHAVVAAAMRRTLLVACDVAGVSSREVNPKQETLANGQLGNYVRLPYPGQDQRSRYIIDHDRRLTCDEFVPRAYAARTPEETFERWAARWTPPAPPAPRRTFEPYRGTLDSSLARLDKPGRKVFTDGPADGDRSDALAYIAHRAYLSGLTSSETFALLDDAAARWGKFDGRRDRTERLQRIVEKGFM